MRDRVAGFGEGLTEPGDAIAHTAYGWLVQNHDVTAPAEPLRDVGAEESSALAVVARDVRHDRATVARHVGGEHGDPGAVRGLDGADDAGRVDGHDDDRIDALVDEAVHLPGLTREVRFGRHDAQVETQALGRLLHAQAVGLGAQRDTDQRAIPGAMFAAASAPDEGEGGEERQDRLTHGSRGNVRPPLAFRDAVSYQSVT